MAELLQALSCSVGSWTFWREGDPGLAGWITVGVDDIAVKRCLDGRDAGQKPMIKLRYVPIGV